jgi:hypothetical protein
LSVKIDLLLLNPGILARRSSHQAGFPQPPAFGSADRPGE